MDLLYHQIVVDELLFGYLDGREVEEGNSIGHITIVDDHGVVLNTLPLMWNKVPYNQVINHAKQWVRGYLGGGY